MSGEASTKEPESPTKKDVPWSDEERLAIVRKILAQVDVGAILNSMPEELGKEGFPVRDRKAVSAYGHGRIAQSCCCSPLASCSDY